MIAHEQLAVIKVLRLYDLVQQFDVKSKLLEPIAIVYDLRVVLLRIGRGGDVVGQTRSLHGTPVGTRCDVTSASPFVYTLYNKSSIGIKDPSLFLIERIHCA